MDQVNPNPFIKLSLLSTQFSNSLLFVYKNKLTRSVGDDLPGKKKAERPGVGCEGKRRKPTDLVEKTYRKKQNR